MSQECKLTTKRTRIRSEAARLTVERGYDGFTMDDLAERVGVSRRTLFNVVPDKESAVLGIEPDFRAGDEAVAFRSGLPGESLVQDLLTMLERVMTRLSGSDAESGSTAASDHRHFTEAIAADPKVLAMANARARRHEDDIAALIAAREDWAEGDLRARALAASVGALVRVSFAEVACRGGVDPIGEVFRETVAAFVEATRDRS